MKRRYKLLLIIIIGIIITVFINSLRVTSKVNLTSLGDGVSLGMTPYNVSGNSFNDYLKERLENQNNISYYNNDFSYKNQSVYELNEHLKNNDILKNTPLKQIIAKSNIITISIGQDYFSQKSLVEQINNEMITEYLNEFETLLKNIREFYEKDIIVIGLYPGFNFEKKDAIEVNSKLKAICGKYDTYFIDILALALNKDYYLNDNSYYFNYIAHKEISKMIYVIVNS